MEANNQKQTFIEKFKSMSLKKKIIVVVALFSLLSVVYIFTSVKTNKKITVSEGTPSPTNNNITSAGTNFTQQEPNSEPKRSDVSNVYLLNRFDTLTGVTGYGWYKNKIIYATTYGIFDLWQNKPLISGALSRVSFSKEGKIAFSNSSGFHLLDLSDNSQSDLGQFSNNFTISSTGDYVLYTSNNGVFVYSIPNNTTNNITINNLSGKSIQWVEGSEYISIYDSAASTLEIYNTDLQKVNQFNITKGEDFNNISPNLKYISTKINELLKVTNTITKNEQDYKFSPSSKLTTYWFDESTVFVAERRDRGIYNLYDQYFWMVDVANNKQDYITNSIVIPNKIDLSNEVTINSNKTALLMKENSGMIWTISLVPTQIVTNTPDGITFTKVSYTNKED